MTLNELKDSAILYDKKLPSFGYILLILSGFLAFSLLVWSIKVTKPYICKGQGTTQSINKTYIMPTYTGEVTEISVEEGSYVNEGDLIARVKSTDISLQQEQISGQIEIYKEQKKQYEKLLKSIQDDTNYFDETSPADQSYYYQYENYKSQIAQNTLDTSTYQSYGYTDAQIQILIDQNQGKIDQIYYSALQSVADKITELNNNISNYENQLDALGNGEDAYCLYAATSGIVHMDNAYKKGMVVSAGSAIGSIANENDEYEIVAYITLNDRPLIHEGDSCTIAVSGLTQSIYGTLTGTVEKIESDVTTLNGGDGNSSSFFKIHVTPDNTYLVSKTGEKVNLSNGMSVETRVIYDEVTYFNYVMESLGVLTR